MTNEEAERFASTTAHEMSEEKEPCGCRSTVQDDATLRIALPHVWDVDGKPRGVVHELRLDGGTLTAREAGLDADGAEFAIEEVSMSFTQAVHILLNLSVEERERFGVARTQPERATAEEEQ